MSHNTIAQFSGAKFYKWTAFPSEIPIVQTTRLMEMSIYKLLGKTPNLSDAFCIQGN